MNVIVIQQVNKGRGHLVLGLSYVKCELDDEKYLFIDMDIETYLEEFKVKNYCLMLPFIY